MKKRESFIEKRFCLCLHLIPTSYALSFGECYPPRLIWLLGRFDFFFFLRPRFDVFLCSIQCHSQLVKWFLKFAVTIKVFTYHVRVHLTSRRETNVLVPVWSRLFERWMARSKLSGALLQPRRQSAPDNLRYRLLYSL